MIRRPERMVYCQNMDCAFKEESWKFRKIGSEENPIFMCPKCGSESKEVEPIRNVSSASEVVVEKGNKGEESMRKMDFIVVDLEHRTVKVISEDRVADEGNNVDLLLPMITPHESHQLQPRAARDFDASFDMLVSQVESGTLPCDDDLLMWINSHLDQLGEVEEGNMDFVEGCMDEDSMDMGMDFDPTAMFTAGFQAGVTFALNNYTALVPPPQNMLSPAVEEEPEPMREEAASSANVEKTQKLMRLIGRNKKRGGKRRR